jgi:hypothetical protein
MCGTHFVRDTDRGRDTDSDVSHLCQDVVRGALRAMGARRACPPCPAPMCLERFALWGRDTRVSALSHSCARCAGSTWRYVGPGGTRTCPPFAAPMCWKREPLCGRDSQCLPCPATACVECFRAAWASPSQGEPGRATRFSTLPRTHVREATQCRLRMLRTAGCQTHLARPRRC